MQLGVFSFGDNSVDPATGKMQPTELAVRNMIERAKLADEVGLDYFGVGEHHRPDFPISSPAVMLGAIAAVTKKIRIGSSVTVLSTEDPVRVFQQFATIDLISQGRAEITVGRGSFIESYPLFGEKLDDYNELFEEKVNLLLQLNRENPISWSGKFRPALDNASVWPRPFGEKLDIWIGTGGTPESSARAGRLGQNAIYAIIGGYPARFAPLLDYYRANAEAAGHNAAELKVGIAGMGLVGDDGKQTKETMYASWIQGMRKIAAERGFAEPDLASWQAQANGDGAYLVGEADEIVERIGRLHESMAYDRHILQMDIGNTNHKAVMRSIELFGTKVLPQLKGL
jgi:probable LLM family oxidoreductase